MTSDHFLSSHHDLAEFSCFSKGIQIGISFFQLLRFEFFRCQWNYLRIPIVISLEKTAEFSYCLSFRPRDGLKLLSDTESQWQPRASLVTHVWWHKALFHFQLGTAYILGQ